MEKAQHEQEIVAVLKKDPKAAIRGLHDRNAAMALGTPEQTTPSN